LHYTRARYDSFLISFFIKLFLAIFPSFQRSLYDSLRACRWRNAYAYAHATTHITRSTSNPKLFQKLPVTTRLHCLLVPPFTLYADFPLINLSPSYSQSPAPILRTAATVHLLPSLFIIIIIIIINTYQFVPIRILARRCIYTRPTPTILRTGLLPLFFYYSLACSLHSFKRHSYFRIFLFLGRKPFLSYSFSCRSFFSLFLSHSLCRLYFHWLSVFIRAVFSLTLLVYYH
jgi:hypothetical protein